MPDSLRVVEDVEMVEDVKELVWSGVLDWEFVPVCESGSAVMFDWSECICDVCVGGEWLGVAVCEESVCAFVVCNESEFVFVMLDVSVWVTGARIIVLGTDECVCVTGAGITFLWTGGVVKLAALAANVVLNLSWITWIVYSWSLDCSVLNKKKLLHTQG